MADEKPLGSWPCPEALKESYKMLQDKSEELMKEWEPLLKKMTKHKEECMALWHETRESLSNMYPAQSKLVHGAIGLFYNEKEGTVESWNPAFGPFMDDPELQALRRYPPLIIKTGEKNDEIDGGTVVDETEDALGEKFRRGRDIDMGFGTPEEDDDSGHDAAAN